MRERSCAPVRGRKFLTTALLALGVLAASPLVPGWQQAEGRILIRAPRRFTFKIDPKTPLRELLPEPPRLAHRTWPLLPTDLQTVREIHFQEPLTVPARPADYDKLSAKEKLAFLGSVSAAADKLLEQTAHQIAKINFLNQKNTDHFLQMLRAVRPDLAGLPFVMGADCRLSKERGEHFATAVRQFHNTAAVMSKRKVSDPDVLEVRERWREWEVVYPPKGSSLLERKAQQQAALAAFVQILPVEATGLRIGASRYLGTRPERETAAVLARLTFFDANAEVRKTALTALEKRAPADVTDVLLGGLQYPWPEIAKNAADAIAHLKRTDLVPKLIDLLDQPDPRAPLLQEVNGKKVPVVRELVRINHHRNCLLCHPPGNTPDVTGKMLTGAVPTPGQSLSPGFYEMQSPDVVVRADVTYLRQDFSRLQKVADAAPWPEMQRFDFLVRTRVLLEGELEDYRAAFAAEKVSPYRQAAAAALRSLTGRDAEPTAAAWRKVLAARKPAQP